MYNSEKYKKYYQKNSQKLINKTIKWMKNNKEKVKINRAKTKNKGRYNAKIYVYNYKLNKSCASCNENRGECLDFHHIDVKNKKNTICKMCAYGYNIKAIQKEIDKCILLCANCHRKKHYKAKKASRSKIIFVQNIKLQSKCCFCPESTVCCLDFHHIDPQKKTEGISEMCRYKEYTIEDIKLELQKCICVCHNCHRCLHSTTNSKII